MSQIHPPTLHRLLLSKLPQHSYVKWKRLSHPAKNNQQPSQRLNPDQHLDSAALHSPSSPLTMIPNIIPRIRMNQRTKRPPPHHKPAHKLPKLLRSEHSHLEHPDRVRADGALEERVDAQFRELAADALVQLFGVLGLRGRGLLEVDVDVETAAGGVVYGGREGGVGGGFGCWGGVDVGFGVGA